MERGKLFTKLQSAKARLEVGEERSQDLTEGYATMKKNYLTLSEAHSEAVAQTEELSAELLTLAKAQDALRRQLEEQQQTVQTSTQGLHGELDRVRAVISRMSRNRLKVRHCGHSLLFRCTVNVHKGTEYHSCRSTVLKRSGGIMVL